MIDTAKLAREMSEGLIDKVIMGTKIIPITEHPDFNKPRFDWGVIPACTIPEHYDDEGNFVPEVVIPEDRTFYRPDLDGKAMKDFWNGEDFEGTPLNNMKGVTSFLAPDITVIYKKPTDTTTSDPV
jgi:hypothetical protein